LAVVQYFCRGYLDLKCVLNMLMRRHSASGVVNLDVAGTTYYTIS